ncbi:hypothetical protein T06_13211 [Trichinella sp. T6]|nr:hypothetical protein T06_13211 [Trichinella sp. T6]
MSLSTRAVTPMVDVIQENSQTFRHTFDRKVHVVKWKDNAVVKIASNYMIHSLLCVRLCNTGMGEADILDRLASLFYRETMSHPPGILLPFCPQLATAKSMCPPKAEASFLSQCPEIRIDDVNHILCTGPKGRCESGASSALTFTVVRNKIFHKFL